MNTRVVTAIALTALATALFVLPMVRPEMAAETHPFLRQEGTFEQFQWPWYLAAAAVIAAALRTARPPARNPLLWLLWACAFLGWREFDLGRTLFLERWYNPTRYIGNPTIPAAGQIMLSTVALAFLGTLGWLAVRHRTGWRAWIAARRLRLAAALAASSIACMVTALACDKYSTLRRNFGLDLDFRERVYAEESLELLAGAFLFFAALEVARQERLARPEDAE